MAPGTARGAENSVLNNADRFSSIRIYMQRNNNNTMLSKQRGKGKGLSCVMECTGQWETQIWGPRKNP